MHFTICKVTNFNLKSLIMSLPAMGLFIDQQCTFSPGFCEVHCCKLIFVPLLILFLYTCHIYADLQINSNETQTQLSKYKTQLLNDYLIIRGK